MSDERLARSCCAATRLTHNSSLSTHHFFMTPERWQQVEAVLQEALDRAAPERAQFLNEACAGDDELKEEATSLIAALADAGEFIEQPALAHDAQVLLGIPVTEVGRDIGPYRIVDRIGSGGMGDVFLAQDARLNRRVARKILPAYFVSDEQRLRRFQTEARAASALNHPNILTIYEVGEAAGLHYIATEFIDGQTVGELINSKSIARAEVLDIVRQLLSGLAAAHSNGIVHRDIKPENIMRRSDGIVKILDFGIAKLLENDSDSLDRTGAGSQAQTELGTVLGTVGYMSPEQARGLMVDERSDISSAGVVLYEMLTGRAPFTGATRLDTMVAILEREPAPFETAAQRSQESQIQNVVNKALKKEADERYQQATRCLLISNRSARRQ
jgi:serine/threonine protein kinase